MSEWRAYGSEGGAAETGRQEVLPRAGICWSARAHSDTSVSLLAGAEIRAAAQGARVILKSRRVSTERFRELKEVARFSARSFRWGGWGTIDASARSHEHRPGARFF